MRLVVASFFYGLFAVVFGDCTDHACLRTQTCCPGFEPGQYGCCPHLDAVCCPDKEHCCPADTICDSSTSGCIPEMSELVSRDIQKRHGLEIPAESPIVNEVNINPCSDMVYCFHNYTCCQRPLGLFYCCPHPNATCCLSGMFCCPAGQQCDDASMTCIQEDDGQLEHA